MSDASDPKPFKPAVRQGERRHPLPQRAGRRWGVPPAMLRDPADKLEGDSILAETPGDFGLLLWSLARDVTLWAGTPPSARDNLFTSGGVDARFTLLASADVPPEVSAPLDTLHGMLSLGSRADAGVVSVCCLEVAAWARRAGLPHAGIAFAQAGALAAPEFAEAALTVGVHARAAGQDARAATWLRRAIALARREGDGAAYSAALVELGGLHERGGSTKHAERSYLRALRASRRCGARSERMCASYGLFRLARQRGDTATAGRFAVDAQRLCEPDAAGGPDLLLDLARFWTDVGHSAHARAALCRLWPSRRNLPPAVQLVVWALAARARSEPGNPRKGRGAAKAAWALMQDEGIADETRFRAAVDLAHGARIAGDLVAFTRAKRAVLRLAPQERYPVVAAEMAEMWPEGEGPPLDRAS